MNHFELYLLLTVKVYDSNVSNITKLQSVYNGCKFQFIVLDNSRLLSIHQYS